jgi:ATP-binding cassette, subfamily C, bacterial LapB
MSNPTLESMGLEHPFKSMARPAWWLAHRDLVILSGSVTLIGIAALLVTRWVMISAVPANSTVDLVWSTIAAIGLASLTWYLQRRRNRLEDIAGMRHEGTFLAFAIRRLFDLRLQYLPKAPAISAALAGAVQGQEAYGPRTAVALADIPFAPLFLVATIAISPTSGLLVVAAGAAVVALACYAAWGLVTASEASQVSEIAMQNMLSETMTGMVTARANPSWFAARLVQTACECTVKRKGISASSLMANYGTQAINAVVYALAMLVVGLDVFQGKAPSIDMLVLPIFVQRTLAPLAMLPALKVQMARAKASVASLGVLFNAPVDVVENPMVIGTIRGDITLSTASYAYPGERPLFSASIGIKAGTTLGVYAPSGWGKSHLFDLIAGRLQPTGGEILLDGVDLKALTPEVRSTAIGYARQRPDLYTLSLRDNIAIGREIDDATIAAALKAVGAEGFASNLTKAISALPENVSGGQKQQISIARAMVSDPAVLLLDEPNASLDAAAIGSVIPAIHGRKARGKTTIISSQIPEFLVACGCEAILTPTGIVPRDQFIANLQSKGGQRHAA